MKIIRVFPRLTALTPQDELVRHGMPGLFDTADQVHISVTFTYDLPKAEYLAKQWQSVAPVTIGGPATGSAGGEFTPGQYLKLGCVITSRGCNNRCWFCSVWHREGKVKELPITQGYIIMDDNLLSCSDHHVMQVFDMLKTQKQKARFTGGLESKLLKEWHVVELFKLRPAAIYFAYDTPDDYQPLLEAGKLLQQHGFKPTNHNLYCYVLIGFPRDTFDSATKRCNEVLDAGFMPYAMLWKNDKGEENRQWRRFQREWSNFVITAHKMKKRLSA